MKIAFYFPYKYVGGVSVLFIRLARYYSIEHDVFIVDLCDGYMRKNIPERCTFIPYDKPQHLPQDCVLITQCCPLWRLPYLSKFNPNIKIFFWNLHPDNLNPNYIRSNNIFLKNFSKVINCFPFSRKHTIKKQLDFLIKNKSITFMDLENLNKTESFFNSDICRDLLSPIVNNLETLEKRFYTRSINNKLLNCIWIGRVDGFKFHILKYTISRLNEIENYDVNLTIVGTGDSKEKVLLHLKDCNKITYNYIDYLPFDKLNDILKSVDICFAMGTSALESASVGVPTICLDYSYKPVNDYYIFNLLHEKKGFILGSEIISPDFYSDSCNLQKLVDYIVNNYDVESYKCYEYCLINHSENVALNLLNSLSDSNATVGDILNENFSTPDLITKLLVVLLRRKKIDSSGFILF